MKKILMIISSILVILFSSFSFGSAGLFEFKAESAYCNEEGECGLLIGLGLVKSSVKDVITEGKFSDHIQGIIAFLLGFITLIAVIYIMYAGFKILTSSGNEETIKKAKNTIIYVVIGILVIWFAWTIANFAISIGEAGE